MRTTAVPAPRRRAAHSVLPRTVVLADGRGSGGRLDQPVSRAVLRLASGTVVVVLVLVVAGLWAGQRVAEQEAVLDVQRLTTTLARTVLEPELQDGLVAGDERAREAVDEVVREKLVGGFGVERVKLWSADGTVVYSDEDDLIGDRFELGDEEQRVLLRGGTDAEASSLGRSENDLDRGLGEQLLEVYTRVETPSGTPLLFEAYYSYDMSTERRDVIFRSFAAIAVVGLLVLAVAQLALGMLNLRWLRQEHARLLARAAVASDQERRRIAADVHDGVVQDLAGASYVVSSTAGVLAAGGRDDAAADLRAAAAAVRTGVQRLRSMIVEIYPASLRSAGLRAALEDLVAPLRAKGVAVAVQLADDRPLPEHVEATLFRIAQEACRNVVKHARASRLDITVSRTPGGVELAVADDGRGFDPEEPAASGHIGLRSCADMVAEARGVLEVASAPGAGTRVRVELPA